MEWCGTWLCLGIGRGKGILHNSCELNVMTHERTPAKDRQLTRASDKFRLIERNQNHFALQLILIRTKIEYNFCSIW